MKTKLVYALAGAIALSFSTYSHAEDKPAGKPEGRPRGSFSPEDRSKAAKELGLDPDEMKNLSPQERMAKYKEAADKKITELQKKKTDGTITAEEKETLGRLESRKQMMEQRGGAGFGGAASPGAEAYAKELGLNPEELKKLPPEERRAKLKEASDKRLAELQKKKADGTLSETEKQSLEKMEQRRKWMESRGEHGPGTPGKSSGDKK
jgi:hypothetical protein